MIFGLIGAAILVVGGYVVYRHLSDASFPASAGTIENRDRLRAPRGGWS
jgi:hypothetical protein